MDAERGLKSVRSRKQRPCPLQLATLQAPNTEMLVNEKCKHSQFILLMLLLAHLSCRCLKQPNEAAGAQPMTRMFSSAALPRPTPP
ncbi:unnamed protein product [Gongylonema pulchrum]|uniref:Uncharacterized protein n=1 Tax=Gongylonema pulchrum TaxID=637853 RepID=A0A183EY77_9BILA|nr:unnamed protein product [Gongylonema pulchrum]